MGNIVEFGHINILAPDQQLATLFYVTGLGLTRDPFLMTGTDVMWVNAGAVDFICRRGRRRYFPASSDWWSRTSTRLQRALPQWSQRSGRHSSACRDTGTCSKRSARGAIASAAMRRARSGPD